MDKNLASHNTPVIHTCHIYIPIYKQHMIMLLMSLFSRVVLIPGSMHAWLGCACGYGDWLTHWPSVSLIVLLNLICDECV